MFKGLKPFLVPVRRMAAAQHYGRRKDRQFESKVLHAESNTKKNVVSVDLGF